MTARGAFSPIEDVVVEAEQRAQREWDREHEPCPHEMVIHTMQSKYGWCTQCGAEVAED